MAGKKRCISTMRALRGLDPALVCTLLNMFPAYQDGCPHSSMPTPAEQRQRVAALRDALFSGIIPRALADMLYHVTVLSDEDGWEEIRTQATMDGNPLSFDITGLSAGDRAVRAWLHAWPCNSELLSRTFVRLHSDSNLYAETVHVYYPLAFDVRNQYRSPTTPALRATGRELMDHFAADGLPGTVSISKCETDRDLCLVIAHVQGAGNKEIRTEDVVSYHKAHGDLRVTARRRRDHELYRAKVGQLVFGEACAFMAGAKVVNMDALRGNVRSLFRCDDIPGLAEIQPVQIEFLASGLAGVRMTWEIENHDSLLHLPAMDGRIMPDDAFLVLGARLRYRLQNRGKPVEMRLTSGSTLTYQRSGDGTVIEDWLRCRGVIRNEMGPVPR